MEVVIEIKRQESKESSQYSQIIPFSSDKDITLAGVLRKINEGGIRDVNGKEVKPIAFEHSCLQKKCGACVMLINDKPKLACDTFLKDYVKKGRVVLAPLSKFPVVRDLIVDRSILHNNLKELTVRKDEEIRLTEKNTDIAYEASRCLMCGCCLEVCPNFYIGGDFYGAAGFVPTTRLAVSLKERIKAYEKTYKKHVYEGCGKSLVCKNICPADIDIDKLLSKSNSLIIWKRGV